MKLQETAVDRGMEALQGLWDEPWGVGRGLSLGRVGQTERLAHRPRAHSCPRREELQAETVCDHHRAPRGAPAGRDPRTPDTPLDPSQSWDPGWIRRQRAGSAHTEWSALQGASVLHRAESVLFIRTSRAAEVAHCAPHGWSPVPITAPAPSQPPGQMF